MSTPFLSPDGKTILDVTPRDAFEVDTDEIIFAIKAQFDRRELAFRELGQNSQDAKATKIRLDHRYENGEMISSFLDDGYGMTEEVVRRHYFRLFDSSKENDPNAVGYFSAGRISMLCYSPRQIEILTLAQGHPGLFLVINQNLSAEFYEMPAEDASAILDSPHGTRVTLYVPMADEKAFIDEVGRINACVEENLCWIRPEVTLTEVKP